jgi:hypothetical protein
MSEDDFEFADESDMPYEIADAVLADLRQQLAEMRGAISSAIEYANGRESEWGDRAEGAFAILYAALSSTERKEAEKPELTQCDGEDSYE